jgi:1-phosphofructokinase family hexose kinase
MMLVAVTPNPAIDRTLYVPTLTVGAIHRTAEVRLAAGGKGLNVTRAARILGGAVLATAPLAGHAGRIVASLAAEEGLPSDWYWLEAGETRTCLLLNHATGDATVINETGPTLPGASWEGFLAHVERLAGGAAAVAFSGSLPPGAPPESLGAFAGALTAKGQTVYLDTSGQALATTLAQPAGLCIKVNRAELAAGLGLPGDALSREGLLEAGRALLRRGAAQVVVTLGAEGALALEPAGGWWAAPPPVEPVVSTVGSGDAFLAGLTVAQMKGQPLEQALAWAVACGAANTLTPLPGHFEPEVAEKLLARVAIVDN